ncbi:MAG: DUF1080 domain-containing protein [Ferruginibacter sp.]|nr:DUF1080 domain-containing protein [Cytophagales bacterium]
MKKILFCYLITASASGLFAQPGVNKFVPLFNGRDLSGWDTYLGKPDSSAQIPGLARNDQGKYTEAVGLNRDPLGVFTVVQEEGQPAIRISGEVFGAITSQRAYDNFHLRLQFKWGERRFPPRQTQQRDSGILYYCVGEPGQNGYFWLESQECQVQEGDCGDYWAVDKARADITAVADTGHTPASPRYRYDRKGSPVVFGYGTVGGPRCWKATDYEKPTGEWNTVDIIAYRGTVRHLINGKENQVITRSRHRVNDREVPLTKGRIQIQSEGAEVFYRRIEIKPLSRMPGTNP